MNCLSAVRFLPRFPSLATHQIPKYCSQVLTMAELKENTVNSQADENPPKKVKVDLEDLAKTEDLPKGDGGLSEEKKLRIKKKKHCMLIGYLGKGYYGMQVNKGLPTIEGELFKAFKTVGVMDEDSYETPQKIQFQRAARTDKGVSAVKQVLSFKMEALEDEKEFVNKVCENLPNQIKVFGIKRVTGGFNSKLSCDYRSYTYIAPSFAFTPVDKEVTDSFRITSEIVNEVNEVLALFKGTHRFHNFTARRKPTDPSCRRFIMEFKCGEPFVREGIEFIPIHIKGQSFMLHQIRKMIGTVIAIMRGLASKEVIDKAWLQSRIDIPIAPALGLVLEEPHYDKYNTRYGSDGTHEPLIWDNYQDEIKGFFNEWIVPTVVRGEVEDKSMFNWLSTLIIHSFDVREEVDSTAKSPYFKALRNLEEDEEIVGDSD
ncbi:pseudouridylate synthase 1 homolog isoform X1 [Artemia franciscana]|uniref:pseudouridylate synthase 1 homolog isoform X1 n=1 Tax=Artemia franciscana TaxID=6661 RepID=UPI0032DB8B22